MVSRIKILHKWFKCVTFSLRKVFTLRVKPRHFIYKNEEDSNGTGIMDITMEIPDQKGRDTIQTHCLYENF